MIETLPREQLEHRLTKILRSMDVPPHRKDKYTPANLRWLERNLMIRNSQHPRYAEALALIRHLL